MAKRKSALAQRASELEEAVVGLFTGTPVRPLKKKKKRKKARSLEVVKAAREGREEGQKGREEGREEGSEKGEAQGQEGSALILPQLRKARSLGPRLFLSPKPDRVNLKQTNRGRHMLSKFIAAASLLAVPAAAWAQTAPNGHGAPVEPFIYKSDGDLAGHVHQGGDDAGSGDAERP